MTDADTIQYEATIEDPKVFSKPWKIAMPIYRHKDRERILEYQCQAVLEKPTATSSAIPRRGIPGPRRSPSTFLRTGRRWARRSRSTCRSPSTRGRRRPEPAINRLADERLADGKPDLAGFYMPDGGGGNYGLGKHEQDFSRGVAGASSSIRRMARCRCSRGRRRR